jgi:hypothetical protein
MGNQWLTHGMWFVEFQLNLDREAPLLMKAGLTADIV